jgi:hypothetical protein
MILIFTKSLYIQYSILKLEDNQSETILENNTMSYYDWELRFKKKPKEKENSENKDELTELGIPKSKFKKFLKDWKKKNLT